MQRPSSLEVLVPAELREAVHRNLHAAPDVLAKERAETIRKWIAWGNELQAEEDELKSSMSPHRSKILAGKRLKLFEKVLASTGHQDSNLVRDISQGFSLTGRLPRSEVFKDCFRPASQTVEMLRARAARARAATLATCAPSDVPEIDLGVEEATLKEVSEEGPMTVDQIPADAMLTRRFGVIQGELNGKPRVRPIDDYKASQVNSCVTQSEQITIHTLDVIAATVAYWMG